MKRLFIFLLLFLISGCSTQTPTAFVIKEKTKYICPDGLTVEKIDECKNLLQASSLSPSLIEEALELGKTKKEDEIIESHIFPEYNLDSDFIGIFTHYIRLALLSSSNHNLTKEQINEILYDNNILFSVQLLGDDENFAKPISARIIIGNETLKPSYFIPQEKASPYKNKFKAYNNYFFEDYKKIKNSKIRFILIYPDKRKEFNIDMLKYK